MAALVPQEQKEIELYIDLDETHEGLLDSNFYTKEQALGIASDYGCTLVIGPEFEMPLPTGSFLCKITGPKMSVESLVSLFTDPCV